MGPICPHWSPRLERAGTYDDAWSSSRAPLLPDDFNPLFFQAAPVDQIYPGFLEERAPIELDNASPSGRLSVSAPAPRIETVVKTSEERYVVPMRLDTLVIDGDAERLQLVWRGSLSVHEQVYGVEWIKITLAGEP